ncbi:MAG: flavin prenyltransferase UbiX [Gammaproteobacteria bacterium]
MTIGENGAPTAAREISLAFTGASGMQYGLRLLQSLLQMDCIVHLMLSKPARVVLGMETDVKLPARASEARRALLDLYGARDEQLFLYGESEWTAPVASGSGAPRQMVVCPCTMASVSAFAVGASRSLIERAADVVLKEKGQLVLVPRETPLSLVHLRNLTALAEAGATILPANPGFYNRPTTVEEIVDFIVARILEQLRVDQSLTPRWGR